VTYLLGKTAVEDFEARKSAFDSNEPFRTQHGQQGYQLFRSVDDPNEAVILFEWDDDEDPRAFFRSEETRERLADAGVKGQPDLTLIELVDQKSAQQPST
jgi:heme-degrading monooxygenase HmoA